MRVIDLPARADPRWNDPDWRRAVLQSCMDLHTLDNIEVADLTGNRPDTVRIWLGGYGSVIGINTLRALILELNARIA